MNGATLKMSFVSIFFLIWECGVSDPVLVISWHEGWSRHVVLNVLFFIFNFSAG